MAPTTTTTTMTMTMTTVGLSAALLMLLPVLLSTEVAAQTPSQIAAQVDPAATCPWQVVDQINTCRATVYDDEAKLPQGPCFSSDWPCICNVQEGLVACFAPCSGTLPSTDIEFNRAQCAGQNAGYVNAIANPAVGTPYSGSPLTTTWPASLPTDLPTRSTSSSTTSSSTTSGGAVTIPTSSSATVPTSSTSTGPIRSSTTTTNSNSGTPLVSPGITQNAAVENRHAGAAWPVLVALAAVGAAAAMGAGVLA